MTAMCGNILKLSYIYVYEIKKLWGTLLAGKNPTNLILSRHHGKIWDEVKEQFVEIKKKKAETGRDLTIF